MTFGAQMIRKSSGIIRQFRDLVHHGTRLLSIGDIETAIAFLSWDRALRAPCYLRPFRDAVDILSFRVPKDTGALYSGQYSTFPDYSLRGGTASGALKAKQPIDRFASSKIRMRDVVLAQQKKHPIDCTEGGRWLLKFNLQTLENRETEQAVWSAASEKYVQNLKGEVEVYLAFPEFERMFRSVEGHALFKNPNVGRIVYFLEHGSSRLANMPPELFGAGIVRHARGKELVFRVARH
jgi:hypothetical protein